MNYHMTPEELHLYFGVIVCGLALPWTIRPFHMY